MRIDAITTAGVGTGPETSRGAHAHPAESKDARPAEKKKDAPARPKAAERPEAMRDLEKLAEDIRKYIRETRAVVDFSVDRDLKQIITRVLEEDTGKVIRQYPTDAAIGVMKRLRDLRGLLIHKKG